MELNSEHVVVPVGRWLDYNPLVASTAVQPALLCPAMQAGTCKWLERPTVLGASCACRKA
jgi:hypothetical protein